MRRTQTHKPNVSLDQVSSGDPKKKVEVQLNFQILISHCGCLLDNDLDDDELELYRKYLIGRVGRARPGSMSGSSTDGAPRPPQRPRSMPGSSTSTDGLTEGQRQEVLHMSERCGSRDPFPKCWYGSNGSFLRASVGNDGRWDLRAVCGVCGACGAVRGAT